MTGSDKENGGRLSFLDSLGRLFRPKEAAPAAPAAESGRLAKLETDFDTVVQALNAKIEEQRRASSEVQTSAKPAESTAEDRAAERARRMETCHRAIRADIEKMHVQLGTGIAGKDLDALVDFCVELDGIVAAGRRSFELLPRLRYGIAERLRSETGTLAVDRLVALLGRANLTWPDPTQYHPAAKPEEIERSRRRRLAELRELFVAQSFRSTAERMLGIISTWGSDYPDAGSPLWQESVLEGVAAGIRGLLLRDFVTLLRQDADALLRNVETSIGKEMAALQGVLAGSIGSVDQANKALASSLHVLDEVIPEVAWQQLRAQSPSARGEFPQ